ncbi:MAG TPA: hypothetical protein VF281_01690 [Candidatus Saccharimonadales bacterium]
MKKDDDGNPFPDKVMIALAKKDLYSGTYLSSIAKYGKKVINVHARVVKRSSVRTDEYKKPVRVGKIELVLELITGLDRAKTLMDPEPDLSEKIETDHVQGSITRKTLNLTD